MLSRVANSLYWMSRYIERAENVARLLDVNLQLLLDFRSLHTLLHSTNSAVARARSPAATTRLQLTPFACVRGCTPLSLQLCIRY